MLHISHVELFLEQNARRLPTSISPESVLDAAKKQADARGVFPNEALVDTLGYALTDQLGHLVETDPNYINLSALAASQPV